jgi:hypothetical protein
MNVLLQSRRIALLVVAIVALIMTGLAIYFRVDQRRLAAQNQKLLIEIRDLQSRENMPSEFRPHPTVLLETPISDETALSFYWFGDMESHFRDPVNLFVVPDGDSRLHKVEMPDNNRQVNAFVSAGEMKRILGGLKALGLSWVNFSGREVFKDKFNRKGTDMLDITLVSSGATAKTQIRIARMCDLLDRLDSAMPSPRILWQFQTFRWDNGCYVRGYDNSAMPPE